MKKQNMSIKIESYIQTQSNFSGSILIAHQDTVIFKKGFGMANYELDAPNTPLTKFRIGSITKPFTALDQSLNHLLQLLFCNYKKKEN